MSLIIMFRTSMMRGEKIVSHCMMKFTNQLIKKISGYASS